jgi:type III pantothenate kinase
VNLLLDLGNSRLKWSCVENEQFSPVQSLPNSQITDLTLISLWQTLQPQKIAISCVGNAQLLQIITATIEQLWGDILPYFAQSPSQASGVINSYSQPEKLGVDRFLALIAVKQKTNSPVCVVDCGTAITVDILNEKGEHQGGLICAGLSLMKKSLALNTADLPLVEIAGNVGLACDTQAAIFNGTLFAACGLIEKVMSQLPENTPLFLTGGDAKQISSQLSRPFILENNLVLQGLNTLAFQSVTTLKTST